MDQKKPLTTKQALVFVVVLETSIVLALFVVALFAFSTSGMTPGTLKSFGGYLLDFIVYVTGRTVASYGLIVALASSAAGDRFATFMAFSAAVLGGIYFFSVFYRQLGGWAAVAALAPALLAYLCTYPAAYKHRPGTRAAQQEDEALLP